MTEQQIQDFHARNQAMEYATRLGLRTDSEVLEAARRYYTFLTGDNKENQAA